MTDRRLLYRANHFVGTIRSALASHKGQKVIDSTLIDWEPPFSLTDCNSIEQLETTAHVIDGLANLDYSSAFFSSDFAKRFERGTISARRTLGKKESTSRDSNGLEVHLARTARGRIQQVNLATTNYISSCTRFRTTINRKRVNDGNAIESFYFDQARSAFDYSKSARSGCEHMRELDDEGLAVFASSLFLGEGSAIITNRPYFETMAEYDGLTTKPIIIPVTSQVLG
jgi:hypothetical protein